MVLTSINNLRGKKPLLTVMTGCEQDYFLARFTDFVTQYQRTSYSELTASLWLSLRLQVYWHLVRKLARYSETFSSCESYTCNQY